MAGPVHNVNGLWTPLAGATSTKSNADGVGARHPVDADERQAGPCSPLCDCRAKFALMIVKLPLPCLERVCHDRREVGALAFLGPPDPMPLLRRLMPRIIFGMQVDARMQCAARHRPLVLGALKTLGIRRQGA